MLCFCQLRLEALRKLPAGNYRFSRIKLTTKSKLNQVSTLRKGRLDHHHAIYLDFILISKETWLLPSFHIFKPQSLTLQCIVCGVPSRTYLNINTMKGLETINKTKLIRLPQSFESSDPPKVTIKFYGCLMIPK